MITSAGLPSRQITHQRWGIPGNSTVHDWTMSCDALLDENRAPIARLKNKLNHQPSASENPIGDELA